MLIEYNWLVIDSNQMLYQSIVFEGNANRISISHNLEGRH